VGWQAGKSWAAGARREEGEGADDGVARATCFDVWGPCWAALALTRKPRVPPACPPAVCLRSKRRVGFVSSGAPARQHSAVVTPDGKTVGEITSGAFSPCLKKNVAMG
jgi:hypothetical protein